MNESMALSASDMGQIINTNCNSSSWSARVFLDRVKQSISFSVDVIEDMSPAEFFRNVPVADEVIEEGSEMDLLAQEAEEWIRREVERRKSAA